LLSLVRFFDQGSPVCETPGASVDKKIEQSSVHCSLHEVERTYWSSAFAVVRDLQYEPLKLQNFLRTRFAVAQFPAPMPKPA
jgi:hypothetical protein